MPMAHVDSLYFPLMPYFTFYDSDPVAPDLITCESELRLGIQESPDQDALSYVLC